MDVAGLLEQAMEFLRQGNLAKAGEICAQTTQKFPRDSRAWYLFSLIMAETQNLDVALELMETAIGLEDPNAAYLQELASLHRKRGNLGAARKSLAHAVGLVPHDDKIAGLLAETTAAEAAATCETAKGVALRDNWQLREAIEALRKTLEAFPNLYPALWYLAATLHEYGDFAAADDHFRRLIGMGYKTPALLRAWAATLEALNRGADAAAARNAAALMENGNVPMRAEDDVVPCALRYFNPFAASPPPHAAYLLIEDFRRAGIKEIFVVAAGSDATPELILDYGHLERLMAPYPGAGDRTLLAGVLAILKRDWYHAAESLSAWLGDADAVLFPRLYALPERQFGLSIERTDMDKAGAERKAAALIELLVRIDDQVLAEATAVALSKHYGKRDELAAAQSVLENILQFFPTSHPLRQAVHVVKLKREGYAPPPYLEKFVGDESHVLAGKTCALPFEFFDITETGDVLVCCGHWVPAVIGNVYRDKPADILNAPIALEIRQSVIDGSFRFCNHILCNVMKNGNLMDKATVTEDNKALYDAVHKGELVVDHPVKVLYGLDRSCNLSCPSCRTEVICETGDERRKIAEFTTRALTPLLRDARKLFLNPGGEAFFSRPSRELLASLNRHEFPDLSLDLISNGMLFTEVEWNKFPGVHDMVEMVRISIDAATKETFEKLRRGGNWERLTENLRFLSRLRRDGVIKQYWLSFTYQLDNFREMSAFADMTESLGCDHAMFERLVDIVYGDAEFNRLAVHLPQHPLFHEFLATLEHPSMKKAIVFGDFDFAGDNFASLPS